MSSGIWPRVIFSFERPDNFSRVLNQLVVNSFERLWRCFASQALICLEMHSIL
ncbi:hypothetical protein GIB67_010420 [Kingdonia uniflora]|uniref:Uncharacterized protein n=1 Tax=Kingdonia uniflora TaxID=39325 RepID=A0A7J7MAB9_9MAGN|nr:hypothetical protein GIB67_010420 [Kingdonia uniflora]